MKQNTISFELCEDHENCEHCEFRYYIDERKKYHEKIKYAELLKDQAQWLERSANDNRHRMRNLESFLEEVEVLDGTQYDWDETRYTRRPLDDAALPPPAAPPKNGGYLYLIKSHDGYYKIGRTKRVPTRFNTLKIQLPMPVELLHSFYVEDCVEGEQKLHRRFLNKRVNGEWFRLDETDVEWITSLTVFVP